MLTDLGRLIVEYILKLAKAINYSPHIVQVKVVAKISDVQILMEDSVIIIAWA